MTVIVTDRHGRTRPDTVVIEEPLEVVVITDPNRARITKRFVHTVTMRTPGNDAELAAGLLLTDGIVTCRDDFHGIVPHETNQIRVSLRPGIAYDPERFRRTGYSSAACGLCGTHDIERLLERLEPIITTNTISTDNVLRLPSIARVKQSIFLQTGGCHAAANFDSAGQLVALFEDVGRHNALDKLIGHAVLEKKTLPDTIVFLSGRAGFEMVQKAAAAGMPIIVSVGAPTSLAIQLADKIGITLIGFVRENDFNIYTHSHRVTR